MSVRDLCDERRGSRHAPHVDAHAVDHAHALVVETIGGLDDVEIPIRVGSGAPRVAELVGVAVAVAGHGSGVRHTSKGPPLVRAGLVSLRGVRCACVGVVFDRYVFSAFDHFEALRLSVTCVEPATVAHVRTVTPVIESLDKLDTDTRAADLIDSPRERTIVILTADEIP
jgi:hypothetical protein